MSRRIYKFYIERERERNREGRSGEGRKTDTKATRLDFFLPDSFTVHNCTDRKPLYRPTASVVSPFSVVASIDAIE